MREVEISVLSTPGNRPDQATAGQGPTTEGRRSLRPLMQLVPYLGRYKLMIAAALLALVSAAATTLVLPMAVRQMIDHGFGADDPQLVNSYFLLLVAVAGALALASSCRFFLVMWIGERIVSDVRADVFAHLTRLSPAFYDSARSGEILSRLTADTTQIKSAFGASASVAMRNFVMFVGAVSLMVYTSPRLSVIVLAAIPVIVLPLIGFGRMVRKRARAAQDTIAESSAFASEMLGSVRTLQAFTAEKQAASRYGTAVETAFQAARGALGARALLTGFAIFVISSSVVAVLWIGAGDVFAGRMTGGELGQFLLYSILAAGALGELSQVWGEISQAAGAAERLAEILRIRPAIQAPAHPKALPVPPRGEIRLDGVAFAYAPGPESGEGLAATGSGPGASAADPASPVVRGVDLAIAAGETVALVGPSGAGKSTLFHLLMRFYDPTAGSVRLDGVDLRDADPEAVRARIALVPQDTVVFGSTAADNIAYGRPGASREEIRRAAELARAHDFIMALPQGYDTVLGERGITLSGGQRQRIAIARAVLKDAPVLLLDEATSALDAESETLVQQALERLMQGRTTVVIAHRLATVLKADRIVVMDQGQIVESGTHAELVARDGLYARLARLQFETGARALRDAS
ncbi:ATP-binding cassette domain-containing protein [Microvirga tunisiensis]|uniref:ATP-binding cassette domain-containing protein n=2 Tax=Pannonibacter tanglangensis TaxID=2750084 RepID=A0A7X5JA85_9HYPH|nr:ATP-binding cassette domain-containing protein [Pannonibacter sp. XCT-53]